MAKRIETLKADWERLQGRYRAAWDAEDAVRLRLRVRHGSDWIWQCTNRERAQFDRLAVRTSRALDAAVLWLEANSPWDICCGVTCRFIAQSLTADMALSSEAPLLPASAAAYGSPAVPFYARRRDAA